MNAPFQNETCTSSYTTQYVTQGQSPYRTVGALSHTFSGRNSYGTVDIPINA